MAFILHIINNNEWSKTDGSYHPESLASDGFIHCSTKDQVIEVANFLYKGQNDLVLLCIDSNRVTSPIKYEDLYEAGEDYPHIYGPLNTNAVFKVVNFTPGDDGTFALQIFRARKPTSLGVG